MKEAREMVPILGQRGSGVSGASALSARLQSRKETRGSSYFPASTRRSRLLWHGTGFPVCLETLSGLSESVQV